MHITILMNACKWTQGRSINFNMCSETHR